MRRLGADMQFYLYAVNGQGERIQVKHIIVDTSPFGGSRIIATDGATTRWTIERDGRCKPY